MTYLEITILFMEVYERPGLTGTVFPARVETAGEWRIKDAPNFFATARGYSSPK
jgi:hypothetical protein